MNTHHQYPSWRRLVHTFGPDLWRHRRLLSTAYFFRLLAVGAGLCAPWPLKLIIDHVLMDRPLPDLLPWISSSLTAFSIDGFVLCFTGVFLFVTVGGSIVGALEKQLSAKVRERLTLQLRDRLLAHLQTLPPTILTVHRSGELVFRLINDTDLFVRVQTKTLPIIFQNVATGVGTLGVMFWLVPHLAIFGALLVPALILLIRYYSQRLGKVSREKRRQEGEVTAFSQEVVRGLPVIQALGNERQVRERFIQTNAKRLQAGLEETRVTVSMERTLQFLQGVVVAITTGGGALLVSRRQLSIGDLTVLLAYVAQLLKPVEKLNDLAETAGRGFAGGERLLALLEQQPLVQDSENAFELERARGDIQFSKVYFSYPEIDGRNLPVLQGVNLRLAPGRLTVLVGASGAGKSTMLHLLVRLFDPSSGVITLDGRPLTQITLRSLHKQIAIMTQDAYLFAGPLRAILTPPDRTVSDVALWEALAFVALKDFVRELSAQLDTPLGEDGLNLSGGQRQRLSLARAFLLDRPVLLLDEPLANIDAASADVIMTALNRLRETHTCLAITHQPALLAMADTVYRLEDGRVAEVKPKLFPLPRLQRQAS